MRLVLVTLILALAACHGVPVAPKATNLQFALIGDNPYIEKTEPKYLNMIEDINRTPSLSWVVHLGDVKGGGQSCADEMLQSRFELNQKLKLPFIITPGDNDWFDCHRETAGTFDPYERLEAFRRIWFPRPGMTTGARPFPVVSQGDTFEHQGFVENVYWTAGDVVFGTVHIVGMTPGEGGGDIHASLMAAALDWLDEIFEVAESTGARGVFIATQVDPYLISIYPGLLASICPICPYVRPGYEGLDAALSSHARAFGKPVLFAVGDTHIFRVDKPLYHNNRLVENFTRVEGFGHPNVHWVRIVVDPTSNEVFEIHQELVENN